MIDRMKVLEQISDLKKILLEEHEERDIYGVSITRSDSAYGMITKAGRLLGLDAEHWHKTHKVQLCEAPTEEDLEFDGNVFRNPSSFELVPQWQLDRVDPLLLRCLRAEGPKN